MTVPIPSSARTYFAYECSRDNILITNSAKHATDLACRTFSEIGDRVIVTAPTYLTTFTNHSTG